MTPRDRDLKQKVERDRDLNEPRPRRGTRLLKLRGSQTVLSILTVNIRHYDEFPHWQDEKSHKSSLIETQKKTVIVPQDGDRKTRYLYLLMTLFIFRQKEFVYLVEQ